MSQKFVQNAAGAFMTISATVKRWDGVAKLGKGAREAAIHAGADPEIFRGYVNLMGRHHAELKAVKKLYLAVYNYLYDNSLPYERGVYLVPVVQVPDLLAGLADMKLAADTARDEFLSEYDRLVKIAQHEAMGDWQKEVASKYPSADSVRERFGITIKPPKPVPIVDMSRIGSIPVELAEQIADANEALLTEQLEKAKNAAMVAAENQMTTLVNQLDGGTRLHDSLITNSQRVSRMLRDMTEGYDNDPRVIAFADLIDEKIVPVKTAEVWKTSPATRKASLGAARKVKKGLDAIQKAANKAAAAELKKAATKAKGKPAENKSPVNHDGFAGVLADLI